MRKATLRVRVVFWCAALGGVVGGCLAYVADNIAEHYEDVLLRDMLTQEMDEAITESTQSNAVADASDNEKLYIDRRGQPPAAPPGLRGLTPGIHVLPQNGTLDRYVTIRQQGDRRFYLVMDVPYSPRHEKRVWIALLAMVVLGIALSAWLGRMLVSLMLKPVLRLSAAVESIGPVPELEKIAHDYHSDEVGSLSRALINYRQSIRAAMERELMFGVDANHELRTPLAIMQGALELMAEDESQGLMSQRRIVRMQRCVAEMGDLIEMLLLVARAGPEPRMACQAVSLRPIVQRAIQELTGELLASGTHVVLQPGADMQVAAPEELLLVMMRIVLRSSALNADTGTRVMAMLDAEGVRVGDAQMTATHGGGDGESGPSAPERSDESGGVGLLRRVCERYGWRLVWHPDTSGLQYIAVYFRQQGPLRRQA